MSGEITQPKEGPKQSRPAANIPAFTVECGDERNRTITLGFGGMRLSLRGWWKNANVTNPQDLGSIASMPDIPGIRIEIKPRDKTMRIYDPLAHDKKLVAKIEAIRNNPENITIQPLGGEKIRPWDEAIHEDLDDNVLKSILLEIARETYGPVPTLHAVGGSHVPTLKDLANCPGDELNEPWSNSSEKPEFVKDVPRYRERLSRQRSEVG